MLTATAKLTRILYEDIVLGRHPFGVGLKEEHLARTHSVKRHTLREAFTRLEDIGFVERIPNRGVYVREPSPQEVREIYQIRTLLETHACQITKLPISPENAKALYRVQDQHTEAVRSGNYRAVLHLNTEFHRLQFSLCNNSTLTAAIEDFATKTHLVTALKFGDTGLMEQVIEQHLDIVAALEGTDHEILAAAIRTHFNKSRIDQYQRQYALRHGDSGLATAG